MGKIEIKTIGVILSVMILLNLTQAELNSFGGTLCRAKCLVKCAFAFPCIKDCQSHCNPAYNYINNCHLIKYIAIDISMYPLKIFIYFHYFNFIFDFINFFSVI